jgi:hypothetical protein
MENFSPCFFFAGIVFCTNTFLLLATIQLIMSKWRGCSDQVQLPGGLFGGCAGHFSMYSMTFLTADSNLVSDPFKKLINVFVVSHAALFAY